MRRRTLIIVAAIAAAVLAIGGGVYWLSQPSYDDHVKSCGKAMTSSATKTDRPEECDELSQKDYDTVRVGWALQHTLDKMSKKDRDMLDYYDDGSINGSIG